MQKWRLIALVAMMAAMLAAGGLALLRGEGPRVTKANFRRIHERMTRVEVERILGPPTHSVVVPPGIAGASWEWRTRAILVVFDSTDDAEARVDSASLLYFPDLERIIDPY